MNLTSHWQGETREAKLFLALPYDLPRGCAAAYFPETNVLVPLDSTARISNTPTSKAIIITVAEAVAQLSLARVFCVVAPWQALSSAQ